MRRHCIVFESLKTAKIDFAWFAIMWLIIFTVMPWQLSFAEEQANPKKVLILYSQSPDFPHAKIFTQVLRDDLQELDQTRIEFSYEYLEMAKYSYDKSYTTSVARFLKEKYAANRPDLVIVYRDPAANFMMQYGENFFPGVPAVFVLDEAEGATASNLPPNYKGIVGTYDMKKAVNLILQVQPDTKKIYVVIGDSEGERKTVAAFFEEAAFFAGQVEFIYLNQLSFPHMMETVKGINGDSVILYFTIMRDSAGNAYIPTEIMQNLYREARVPIYGVYLPYIGMGSVGGYMVSAKVLAHKVAEVGHDILHGHGAARAPIEKIQSAEYIFDWRELKRWEIDESQLPINSRIEFKQFNIWESYRWHIVGAVVFMLLEAVLIVVLLVNLALRKKAQRESLQARKRFEKFFLNSPAAMSIYRLDTQELIDVNPAWERLYEYSRSEAVGRSVDELELTVPGSPQIDRFRNRMMVAGAWQSEIEMRTRSGKVRQLLCSAASIEVEGEAQSMTSIIDVTDHRRMEAEIGRLDRLNLVGEMAAGIGHEVRNPLTTVRGYLQIFQRKNKFVEYRNQLDTMIEELDRANAIITDFLSLAKNKSIDLKLGNLNETIHALFPLLQADAFHLGNEIQTDLGDIPAICYDDKEMRQLILNIVRNGLEAMADGGLLTIKTYVEDDEIVIAISDTGMGIPGEVLDKLGMPFVTTKERGTGLGLSVCYRIAESHGAKIEVKTSPEGTTFYIKFNQSMTLLMFRKCGNNEENK